MNYAARKLARRLAKLTEGKMYARMSYNNKAGSPKYVQVTQCKFGFRIEFENGVIQSLRETPNVGDTLLGYSQRPTCPSDFSLSYLLHIGKNELSALEQLLQSWMRVSVTFTAAFSSAPTIQQLCNVQPMSGKIGQVFFMNEARAKGNPIKNTAGTPDGKEPLLIQTAGGPPR